MVSRVIPVQAFDLVVFGGTGDLAKRKILPSLFRRFVAGQMPNDAFVIGVARSELDTKSYQDLVVSALKEFEPELVASAELEIFIKQIKYVQIDAQGDFGWSDLADKVRKNAKRPTFKIQPHPKRSNHQMRIRSKRLFFFYLWLFRRLIKLFTTFFNVIF